MAVLDALTQWWMVLDVGTCCVMENETEQHNVSLIQLTCFEENKVNPCRRFRMHELGSRSLTRQEVVLVSRPRDSSSLFLYGTHESTGHVYQSDFLFTVFRQ